MTIELKSITLQDYRTFKLRQIFDIDSLKNGLYFITGNNLLETKLGSNNSGKTSLVESVTSCLYGKTSTNLRTDNIINWESKTCVIEVIVNKNGLDYSIKRTWKPNSLVLTHIDLEESVIIDQDKLDNFLNCNFESFLYSVHIAQFTSKFIDLKPADRLQIFTDILNDEFSKWDNFSDKSKKQSISLENDLKLIKNTFTYAEGRLNTLKINDYALQIRQWEEEKSIILKDYHTQINLLNEEVDLLNNKIINTTSLIKNNAIIDRYNEELTEQEYFYKQAKVNINNISTEIQKITKEIGIVYNYNIELKTLISEINKQKQDLTSLTNSLCPVCHQIIPEKHINNENIKLENKLINLHNTFFENEKNINKLKLDVEKLNKTYNLAEATKSDIDKKINRIKEQKFEEITRLNKLNSDLNMFNLEKERVLKNINKLNNDKLQKENNENPFMWLKMDNDEQIKIFTRYIKTLAEQINEIDGQLTLLDYWNKGFKDIKLFILEGKIAELEIFINNILNDFGISDWKIKLQTFNETKAGTIKNGLTVLIESPINKELVPFECWGGGLGQRFRLATTLGIMSFIRNRQNGGFNTVFFDEPTQFLNTEGIEDFIDILSNYVKTNKLKGFLIDHRNLQDCGKFEGVINIVKDKEGSKIHLN